MTISIRRLSLGSGYRYLMESVARGDGAISRSSSLSRYYAESGTPPGRFLGAGLAGLDRGNGVEAGTVVTEEHLFRMLGMVSDPVTGENLARKPNRLAPSAEERISAPAADLTGTLAGAERQATVARIKAAERAKDRRIRRPVAGFDLTFSVSKSISAAWAVADEGTKAIIYDCHQEAIRRTVAYAEAEMFHSRSGTNGVVQEDVRGVVAAGFDHWDSRAGDPHLHTHVVVLNRAQSASDGKWRTLDSRGLFKAVVTLSELHEGILSDLLTEALGWGFDPRQRKHSTVPNYEVAGVSDQLIAEFSQRSAQIEDKKNALVTQFVSSRGRQPTSVEVLRLRQQATLVTRPDKTHRSLAEMTGQWRQRATHYVHDNPISWVETLWDRNDLPLLRRDDLIDEMLAEAGQLAIWKVAERRATFSRANVLAEVHRQLHGIRFASPDERMAVADHTAAFALAGTLTVSVPELHHTPGRFRRTDGTSRFRGKGTQLYTTQALLDAEARLLEAGRTLSAPALGTAVLAAVCEANLPARDYGLSVDQALAVEQIATSGRVLDVLVGPAGTGKTTTMAGLRAVWEAEHGAGSVIGLAPSAAAAEALGAELGITAENTAKWLTEAGKQSGRLAEIDRLRSQLASRRPGSRSYRAAKTLIETLAVEVERWRIRPGQLVIVDEASLAGTFALDELASQATDAGAKVLLVGDWAQLSAVEAGGAFSMLVRDRDIAPELTDVRRFTAGWERAASVELRVGTEAAIAAYAAHGRIAEGGREEMLDAVYAAWRADIEGGKSSLMIAGDMATVFALNERARADRIAAGEVAADGLDVAGGGLAGVGDRVVTRQNNRHLATGKRWVKNGDQWVVTATNTDGSMAVQRAKGGGQVVLPAEYVRDHVELGYASSAHRSQGATVDTAHAMVTATTSREVFYVAATRGRESNRLYVDVLYDPDYDTSHGEPDRQTAAQVLAGVLGNVGADMAAHTMIRSAQDAAGSMTTLAAEYHTIARAAQAERWDALLERSGLSSDQLLETRESEAHGPLLAAFRDAEARGLDVDAAFPMLVRGRTLIGVDDVGSILHGRVHRWIKANSAGRRPATGNLIAGIIPAALNITDPDMQRSLTERADAMEARARALAERAVDRGQPWARSLGPAPTDPALREAWLAELATVAAYRDHWGLSGVAPVGAEDERTIEQLGHRKRARAAVDRAQAIARHDAQARTDTPLVHTVVIEHEGPGL